MENKQINELEKLELEKNKLLLSAENVIGFTSTITFLSSVLGAAFVECSDLVKAVFIVSGTTIFVTGISFALKIEQKAGYYYCEKCGHKQIPKFNQVLFATHINRTRKMKCPICKQKSWQKKIIK